MRYFDEILILLKIEKAFVEQHEQTVQDALPSKTTTR